MKVIIKNKPGAVNTENLQPGTVHERVECPREYKHLIEDVWVMGQKEPVRLLSHEYEIAEGGVRVRIVDMAKINADLEKSMGRDDVELTEKKLALVVGTTFVTDSECCFYVDEGEGINVPVVEKPVKKYDENGEYKGMSISMFPVGDVTITIEQLENYLGEEVELEVFMGDRYNYNGRLRGNLTNLVNQVNNFKK